MAVDTARSADQHTDTRSVLVHLEKLDHLEQEYLRLTHTQNNAEVHRDFLIFIICESW